MKKSNEISLVPIFLLTYGVLIIVTCLFLENLVKVKELEKENMILQLDLSCNEQVIQVVMEEDIHTIASETYNIPKELLIAIEQLESGYYTSDLYTNKNNTWGCRRNGEWTTFNSTEESTMELARTLRYNYFDNGLNTPELISTVFCPETSEEWATSINNLMKGY